ncbi:MAG: L-threonylcarbamoyladenylate synthase, partial [Bacillota bacterium]
FTRLTVSMQTRVGGIELVAEAASIIASGGLVAFPTETVYGLGADAFNTEAVKSTFIAKGRPQDNPLIVHIASVDDITKVACDVPEVAYVLLEKFSPGPLTIVLNKVADLPLTTTGGLQTVGVRIPNHPLALALIAESGCAISAPSANTSGRISPTEAAHVYEDMLGKIPMILDGGKTSVGIESTVLDLTSAIPTVLRPGGITVEMLAEVIGTVVDHKGEVKVASAPGMKYKHYAPTCKCCGAKSSAGAHAEYARFLANNDGKRAVIIGNSEFLSSIANAEQIDIGTYVNECTSNLFSALRQAEKEYDYIILQWFEEKEANFAINNRIHKATAGYAVE